MIEVIKLDSVDTDKNILLPNKENMTLKANIEPNYVFHIEEDGKNIEFLKISNEGFFYKGEKIDDIHNVYERFNEWLSKTYR